MSSVALQSKDHRDLLDIIDKLRSQGTSRYVDLPEIIVCGDQSAGKSSVLEAISGQSFPTKDNLCTRFATELVLRRDDVVGTKISINPGPERSEEERERLLAFKPAVNLDDGQGLGDVIETAKGIMGLSETKAFSADVLRIELCGPTQPHLTMVDLPGIFRAGNKDQSAEDVGMVRRLVRGYMKRPRSIILAVVSAKSDFANQEVTEMARELDPSRTRTLGLITKPDCLDAGSDSERAYVNLAQNKDVVFQLGWHVLRNRTYEMRNASLFERNQAEDEFFSKGIWRSFDPAHVGISSLRVRLSNVLKDQILRQLPSLIQDVEDGISECQEKLERLGSPRATLGEQRRYLLRVGQDFSTLMRAATDGLYRDSFFGSSETEEGYAKRLRAVVQNTLTEFEVDMREDGKTWIITDDGFQHSGSQHRGEVISRSRYLEKVKDLMRRNRGCELPGTFPPLIIGELFSEQCKPWKEIANRLKGNILDSVYRITQSIIDHLAVSETAEGIARIVNAGIDKLKKALDDKVTELLVPHYSGHPITYNHYLTDQVQKAQADRRRRLLQQKLGEHSIKMADYRGTFERVEMDIDPLLDILVDQTEADMELHATSLAVDYMNAYYKVSIRSWKKKMAKLGIECGLT